jgi:molybdate transport system substrate-binding protein
VDGLRGREKSIDTATRETLLGNSLVVVAPKASAQADITINKETTGSAC